MLRFALGERGPTTTVRCVTSAAAAASRHASTPRAMRRSFSLGGKTIVLGGDYRQTLPIVKMASRAQTVDVALTRSKLWKWFAENTFKLTENMRIEQARAASAPGDDAELEQLERFARWLLRLGEGKEPTEEIDTIK